MDPQLGEVVDEQDEVARAERRAERRANRRAQAQERCRRIVAMIMAERNQNDVKKFNDVFQEGTNITDELIIWWARDRASFHRFQATRKRWTQILAAAEGRQDWD